MIELKPQTLALLDEIESRIDPEIEDDFAASGPIFCTTVLPGISFPPSAAKKALRLCPAGTYASTRRWTIWRPCFTRSF